MIFKMQYLEAEKEDLTGFPGRKFLAVRDEAEDWNKSEYLEPSPVRSDYEAFE